MLVSPCLLQSAASWFLTSHRRRTWGENLDVYKGHWVKRAQKSWVMGPPCGTTQYSSQKRTHVLKPCALFNAVNVSLLLVGDFNLPKPRLLSLWQDIFAAFVCLSALRITARLTGKKVVFMWCHTADDGRQTALEELFDIMLKNVAAVFSKPKSVNGVNERFA